MQTQLVKIVPDAVSWSDWAWEGVKENPGKTVGLSLVAVSLLPLEAGVAATGAVIGGIAGLAVGAVGSFFRSSETIPEMELKDSSNLSDVYGAPISHGKVYAYHPDLSRKGVVISADAFHSTIVSEQIADLAAFIRSKVRAETIDIAVFAESGVAVAVDTALPSDTLGIKAHAGSARHHSLELRYDEPELVPLRRNPFWLQSFPEIGTAFEDARKGKVKRSVSVDTTFGLSASLAKVAGIDANWLGKQRFEVEATFA